MHVGEAYYISLWKGDLWVVSMNKKYKRRRIALVLGVVLPVLCYAGYVFSVNFNVYKSLEEQTIVVAQQLEEKIQENEQLKQEVEYTKTDDYIVQKAREILGYEKPGAVKFVKDDN